MTMIKEPGYYRDTSLALLSSCLPVDRRSMLITDERVVSLADPYGCDIQRYSTPGHCHNGRRERASSGRSVDAKTSQPDPRRYKASSSNALDGFFSLGHDLEGVCTEEPSNNWMKLHPSQWSRMDVFELIFFVAEKSRTIDLTRLRGEQFKDIDGHRLPDMTRQDFIRKDPLYGSLLYDTIDDLLNKCSFFPPDDLELHQDPSRQKMSSPKVAILRGDGDNFDSWLLPKPVEELMMDTDEEPHQRVVCNDNDKQPLSLETGRRHDNNVIQRPSSQPAAVVKMCGHTYEIDSAADFRSVLHPSAGEITAHGDFQYRDELSSHVYFDLSRQRPLAAAPVHHSPIDLRIGRPSNTTPSVTSSLTSSPWSRQEEWPTPVLSAADHRCNANLASVAVPNVKRKCYGGAKRAAVKKTHHSPQDGRRTHPDEASECNDSVGVTSGGRHLWEFIRDLLRAGDRHNGGSGTVIVPGGAGADSATPVSIDSIIRWENKEDGVFRIIDSKIVAQLWGCRKHNSTMTYEKLSRALRWCRKNRFFASLPKDVGYPKKLCFKFGPLAKDWRDS